MFGGKAGGGSAQRHRHYESHFKATNAIRDVVIGMSDGLTVPFALAAGITGAIASSHIVVTAGVAELAAGGISMGLGGYLATRTQDEHYASEMQREFDETEEMPEEERREIEAILAAYGLEGDALRHVSDAITSDRERWVDFMMRFELGLEEPVPGAAPISALRIGGSYVIGGILPLLPYFFIADARVALWYSVAITAVALVVFGAGKARFSGAPQLRSAIQTVLIGGVAAAAAFFIARLVS